MILISNLDHPLHLVGFQNRVFIVKAINEPGNLLTLIVFENKINCFFIFKFLYNKGFHAKSSFSLQLNLNLQLQCA